MKDITLIISLLVILLCNSFTVINPYKSFHLTGYAQGTTYSITYYAARSAITIKQTDSVLKAIDRSLSIYEPASLINKFNNSTTGIKIDQHLYHVVSKALSIFKQTDGVADITVLPLVEAWGFGAKKMAGMPDSATITSLLSCVGSNNLILKKDSLVKSRPCTRIDVNGIAQGYSVDVLARFMEQKGITNYVVELGGELRIRGRKSPGNELMKIGIESPYDDPFDPASFRKVVRVDRGAITTSGNYRKYRNNGSRKISHLIDPVTGYSFSNEMISATVWARDAITADGLDNALMGMGVKKAMLFLQQHKEAEAYLIYVGADGLVKDTATKGFLNMMVQ